MSYWQKVHARDPKGDFVKVTNTSGKSFLCENANQAEWLIKLLRQHAGTPETWNL